MAEPFTVSARASKDNIEVWARAQGDKTRIASKVGQDGQTVLYAKSMGKFEALFHKTTKEERVQTARTLVEHALKADPRAFTQHIQGGGQRMLSLGKLSQLPESFRNSAPFQRHLADLGVALSSGDMNAMDECGIRLADAISQELRKQPFSEQMRFALADTHTLAKELLTTVVATAREYLEKTGGDAERLPSDRLDQIGTRAKVLTDSVDRIMANLSDHALSDTEIRINGHSYLRDPQPLGNGAFGNAYLYRAAIKGDLKPGEPEVLVVKHPTDGFGQGKQEGQILGPLREARALVNGAGTGASDFSGNVARFHSAVRGMDGSVLVVMRLEEGGAAKGVFDKALNRLGSLNPDTKITEKQYEDMTLTLMKDAMQGALRFHEGGKVTHFDLKIDNVLVSKDGTGRVADPGASRGLGDINELDSPGNTTHFTPVAYTAPERFVGGKSTTAADVFALGMSLLEALSKNGPLSLAENGNTHPLFTGFGGDVTASMLRSRVVGWAKDPNAVMLPPGLIQPGSLLEKYAGLINEMTSPSPGKRPTIEQVLAHPLFNQPGQGTSEIRELIKSIALPKPPVVQPVVNQGQQPQGEINLIYQPDRQQPQGSQQQGQFSVSSVPYVGVNQLPEKISVSNVRYLHENSPDALRSVGEVPEASLMAYGPSISAEPRSNTYDSMEQLNANLANSQNHERSDSLLASGPQGSGAIRGEGSPLRNDDPRGAYDPLPPSNDVPIPDGKREIPDDSSPLQGPEIRYL